MLLCYFFVGKLMKNPAGSWEAENVSIPFQAGLSGRVWVWGFATFWITLHLSRCFQKETETLLLWGQYIYKSSVSTTERLFLIKQSVPVYSDKQTS